MSPETVRLKAWVTLRARACRLGVIAYRTDPLDGPVQYFTLRIGVPKLHADMRALTDYIEGLEQQARCTA